MASRLPVKSAIYRYANLTKNNSSYSVKMSRLSKRIFTEVVRPTSEASMRVVNMFARRPIDLDQRVMNYYPRHMETYKLMMTLRAYGLYRDEHEDFKEEMERLRKLRGKGKDKFFNKHRNK